MSVFSASQIKRETELRVNKNIFPIGVRSGYRIEEDWEGFRCLGKPLGYCPWTDGMESAPRNEGFGSNNVVSIVLFY